MYKPSPNVAIALICAVAATSQLTAKLLLPTLSYILARLNLLQGSAISYNHEELPTNYFGATIFILYIVAALALTLSLCSSLLREHRLKSRNSHASKHKSELYYFCTFSVISFATLSYNMVMFLVISHLRWNHFHGETTPVPENTWQFPYRIWCWMTQSSLFVEFAHELHRGEVEVWWTGHNLMLTFLLFLAIGEAGSRVQEIPGLWKYLALAQILPPSFAGNLLMLAITMHEDTTSEKSGPSLVPNSKAVDVQQNGLSTHFQSRKLDATQPSIQVAERNPKHKAEDVEAIYHPDDRVELRYVIISAFHFVAFRTNLSALQAYARTEALIPLILTLRLLLLFRATYPLLPIPAQRSAPTSDSTSFFIWVAAWGCGAGSYIVEMPKRLGCCGLMFFVNQMYAVRALGWDIMLVIIEIVAVPLVIMIAEGWKQLKKRGKTADAVKMS